MTTPHPTPRLSLALDGLAFIVIAGLMLYLPGQDGGFLAVPTKWVGWISAAATPVFVAQMRFVSSNGRMLAAAWGLGALLAFAFAVERTSFWMPAIVYASIPLICVAGMRVWQRRWGPTGLLMLFLASFALTWYEGFAVWHGTTVSNASSIAWRSLSFNHQSAATMLFGGISFAALATVAAKPIVRLGMSIIAAAGLGAAWLSDSNWSTVAALLGLLAVGVAARMSWRSTLPWFAGTLVAGIAFSLILNSTQSNLPEQGTLTLDQSIDISRLDHWEAGLSMFIDRPMIGRGLGSFATAGGRFADPGDTLTIAALNEPIEAFAEGGLVFGLPVLLSFVVLLGMCWKIISAGLGMRQVNDDAFRIEMSIAAASTAAALAVHAVLHFDWMFPLTAVYLAVAAGIVFGTCSMRTEPADRTAVLWGLPIAALLAIGLVGASIETRPSDLDDDASLVELAEAAVPWNGPNARALLTQLVLGGEVEAAEDLAARAVRWNPGYPGLRTLESIVDYLTGAVSADEVRSTLNQDRPDFASFNLTARILSEAGDLDSARAVAGNAIALYRFYEDDQPINQAYASWLMYIDLTGRLQGCEEALSAVEMAGQDVIVGLADLQPDFEAIAAGYCG
ncbi:MAG: O-antigen ligase family protein [Acidimicrobiia bacterium]|nr:O-antigen ligase family protein [Acidimicrobiia bacterium]